MPNIIEALSNDDWKGEPCFVFGGGPSLGRCDLSMIPEGAKTIGCNVAWKLNPDLVMVADESLHNGMISDPDWQAYKGMTLVQECHRAQKYREWKKDPLTDAIFGWQEKRKSQWSYDLKHGLAPHGNTGCFALHLADLLGCSEIYLLGIDCVVDEDGGLAHWHDFYGRKSRGTAAKKIIEAFEKAAPFVKSRVFNCSDHSAIRVFPHLDFAMACERAKNILAVREIKSRLDVAKILSAKPGQVRAAELGVAKGDFSRYLLENVPNMRIMYSIDKWDDHHAKEERVARAKLQPFGDRSWVKRCRFEEYVDDVPERSLDLVYIDGYAHEGQEHGKTLDDWFSKVKPGGIIAGHDYSDRYHQTKEVVNVFAARHKLSVHVSEETTEVGMDGEPSWWSVV